MEVSSSSMLKDDDERRDLEGLLDSFGSLFSLEEIASAYCKARRNIDLAGDILYDLHESTSISNTRSKNLESLCINAVNGDVRDEKYFKLSNAVTSKKSPHVNGKYKRTMPRSPPTSVGTVSSVLGKSYNNSTSLSRRSSMGTKPLKLESKALPAPKVWREKSSRNSSKDDTSGNDIEDNLFKMLECGVQLDKDLLLEIVGSCGHDMEKSIEKLIAISDKEINFLNDPSKKSKEIGSQEWSSSDDLVKEVLTALFHASERQEESSIRTLSVNGVERSKASTPPVAEALHDTIVEQKSDSINNRQYIEEDDGDDSYRILRGAVKEYRATMKEYYKAAVEAFTGGDRDRAKKLLEEGHFFHKKACEADEESVQKIFMTTNEETEDAICLDLHSHTAKEAIRLLKCHLTSLCGIPSMKYLKAVVETNDEDMSRGARKRQIIKFLEKKSIKWIEEGSGGTILIYLDEINPKNLSFPVKNR